MDVFWGATTESIMPGVSNLALSRFSKGWLTFFIYLVDVILSICPPGDAFMETGN